VVKVRYGICQVFDGGMYSYCIVSYIAVTVGRRKCMILWWWWW